MNNFITLVAGKPHSARKHRITQEDTHCKSRECRITEKGNDGSYCVEIEVQIRADRGTISPELKPPMEQVYGPESISAADGVSHIKHGVHKEYEMHATINLELSQPQSQKSNKPDVMNLG